MKKLLAVLLSVIVLLTSCWCVFGTLASVGTKDYLSPSSWGLYKTGHSAYPAVLNGNSQQSWAFHEETTIKCGESNSIMFDASTNIITSSTKLEGLTSGKKYTVYLKYYLPSTLSAGSQGFIFRAGVFKKDAPLTNAYTVNTTYALTGPTSVTANTGEEGGNPVWKEMTLTFVAEAEQHLAISSLRGGSGNMYFSDIRVEEGEPKVEIDYTSPNAWGSYKTGNASYPALLSGASIQKWMFSQSDTVLCNGKKSIAISSGINIATAAARLVNLEQGQDYKLKFKYYIPTGMTAGSQGFIFRAGVYKNNAPLTNAYTVDASYQLATPVKVASATGMDINGNPNWGEVVIDFTADAGQYLALNFLYGGADAIHIADVVVEEPDKDYNLAASWKLYKPNNTQYPGKLDDTSNHSWMFHEETTIKCGENNSLRFDGSANAATPATKLTKLESGKRYTVSFKYYVPSSHIAGAAGYIFKAAVYKENAPVAAGGLISDATYLISDMVTVATATGKDAADKPVWEEATLEFKAGDGQYLVITPRYGLNPEDNVDYSNIYFADITVSEVPKDYSKADDWGLYKNNSTAYPGQLDNSSAMNFMFTEETEITPSGKGTIKMASGANVATAATKLENLIIGKKYKLTFKYYIPEAHTAGGAGYIFKSGVYKKDAPVAAGGVVTDATYFMSEQVTVSVATGRDKNNSPIWKEATFIFDAADEQYLGISLRYMGNDQDSEYGNIYVADVRIKEVLPAKDYNSNLSWGAYRNGVHKKIDGAGVGSMQKETTITYNGGAESLRINKENLATMATELQDLEPGKKYAVAFKYYITPETAQGSDKYIFKAGVYKENAALAVGVNVATTDVIAEPIKVAAATGKDKDGNPVWADFVTTFTATAEPLYFGIAVRVAPAEGVEGTDPNYALIYIDDVEVYELSNDNLGTPAAKHTVDFEDDNKTYINANVDRFEIVTAKNAEGKDSKMLYYKPGVYGGGLNFNHVKVYTETDPNLTVAIKDDTVYKITYKYKLANKVNETDKATDWLSFYTFYDGAYSTSKEYNVATAVEKDVWHTYETYYSPIEGQTHVSLGFQVGEISNGIWIDDITIEETDLTLFKGHKAGEVKYEINFDDYSVPLDNPFIKVENGPERDGKVTKAAHIAEVNAPQAVTSNDISISRRTERVFAIPVEPNTCYSWSFWAYSVTEAPIYFGFYYNYNSADIYTNILRYHEKAPKVGVWQKYTVEFKTNEDQHELYTWFNAGNTTKEAYIDEIILEKMLPGTTAETDLFYCEDYFNLITEKDYKDLIAGKSGVYKFNVKDNLVHTFAIAASGKGKVTLSLDGVTPMGYGATGAPSSTFNFTGSYKSTAVNLFTSSYKEIYIIVENEGNLKFDELMFFVTKSENKAERPMGYVDNPNVQYVKPDIYEFETK